GDVDYPRWRPYKCLHGVGAVFKASSSKATTLANENSGLTSFGALTLQGHARRGGLGDQLPAIINNFAFRIANGAAAPYHFAFGPQVSPPHRAKEIDL